MLLRAGRRVNMPNDLRIVSPVVEPCRFTFTRGLWCYPRAMRFFPFLITAVWVFLDQWLKMYVVDLHTSGQLVQYTYNPDPYVNTIPAIPGFMNLAYTINLGAATPALVVLRFVAGMAILGYIWMNFSKLPRVQWIAFALIAGGALGNAIDGALRGHVVDMLVSHTLTAIYKPFFGTVYPIFNIADVGVVSGVLLLVISSFFVPQPAKRAIQ
jgi:signal peptidase II